MAEIQITGRYLQQDEEDLDTYKLYIETHSLRYGLQHYLLATLHADQVVDLFDIELKKLQSYVAKPIDIITAIDE